VTSHLWSQYHCHFVGQPRCGSYVTVTETAGVKKSLLGLDSWIAAAEEVSLQRASEGGKRRCRCDVLRQTVVPNTGCSDWKGPVADS